MKMSFRWYGKDDSIPLNYIAQIPGMEGVVSAIYDIPVGEVWPEERIRELKEEIEASGLTLTAIESLPVHEDIKLGLETRDEYIAHYQQSLRNLARVGVEVVTYNFMPVFDWTRSELAYELDHGATALRYDQEKIKAIDPTAGRLDLPGWDTSFDDEQLQDLLQQYQAVSSEDLWNNLAYFLQPVIEVAEEVGIKMAIHPDDPPWSIFGLPRIITNKDNLERLLKLVDSPSNGLALCTGSLGADPDNDLPDMIRYFGGQDRIHFAHVRNIRIDQEGSFTEVAHLNQTGALDMYQIMKAYYEVGFTGPLRPDHGRMIWGETGKPGYGLYDRALGATYLHGLWEAIVKNEV